MNQQFADELKQLQNTSGVNIELIHKFLQLFRSNKYIKVENPLTHLGSFFIPIHKKSKSIYLAHHKKAKCWIPPGGHMEKGESAKETVRRELREELSYHITDEVVSLYDISVSEIRNIGYSCKIHYDFWYIVEFNNIINFDTDNSEFYDAKWVSGREAINLINTNLKHPEQTAIIKKTLKNLNKYE